MNKKTNYFFLVGFLFVVYLVMEFTNIYGDSTWFKAYLIILSVTFLITAVANRNQKSSDNEQK
jgi:hypothetical protein